MATDVTIRDLRAYNLTVDQLHTYHVGATPVLVHNCGPESIARLVDDVLPTPRVESGKLQNIVDNLYKGTTNPNRVGNGTTMDAIRSERATGLPTGGKMHTVKGQGELRGQSKWLRKNQSAAYGDRLVAQSLANELKDVLRP